MALDRAWAQQLRGAQGSWGERETIAMGLQLSEEKTKRIKWSIMAQGGSSVLSPMRAVLVNVLIHGLEIEADESIDGTELM